jgi:hypothetical protein
MRLLLTVKTALATRQSEEHTREGFLALARSYDVLAAEEAVGAVEEETRTRPALR